MPSLKTLEKISHALHISLRDFFDFDYPQDTRYSAVEREIAKLITFLKTKRPEEINICYCLPKSIFEQIDAYYQPKR